MVERIYSLPLGTVRLTEGYLRSDPIKPREWKKLRKAIDRTIKKRIRKPPFRAKTLIGSGGTFSTLAAIAKNQREGGAGSVHGYTLSRSELVALLDRLRQLPLEARRQVPGLSPDRADIIVAGIAAIARLAKRLGSREIRVNEGGVREGLFLSMIGERRDGRAAAGQVADRMEWIRLFARRCRSNEMHCEHVAYLAGQIFDGLKDEYELPEEGRELLTAAALLHDIGYLIGHAKHHKHAYHLILHGDLPAFSAREVELIANVARYHRKARPKKKHATFARLQKNDRRLVIYLSGILRVADGLDRTQTQAVRSVECRIEDDRIKLVTEAEAPPRVELWDANRKAGLFEKVYSMRLKLDWKPPESQLESTRSRPRNKEA